MIAILCGFRFFNSLIPLFCDKTSLLTILYVEVAIYRTVLNGFLILTDIVARLMKALFVCRRSDSHICKIWEYVCDRYITP